MDSKRELAITARKRVTVDSKRDKSVTVDSKRESKLSLDIKNIVFMHQSVVYGLVEDDSEIEGIGHLLKLIN